jgi:hypothetical protein
LIVMKKYEEISLAALYLWNIWPNFWIKSFESSYSALSCDLSEWNLINDEVLLESNWGELLRWRPSEFDIQR